MLKLTGAHQFVTLANAFNYKPIKPQFYAMEASVWEGFL